ncbi:antibiotic biosynthesis monooxygenase [Marinobacter sp. NFXS9]|uniref:antibiotic biosynthesis monooxygenase family protein n=1 Tax=Marinobacter sp. NFXS9 TaxID=2818433 RepID=UPI0032DE7208
MADTDALIADTPEPPYYVVIFTSLRTDVDQGYDAMARKMVALAAEQPGFLGVESAREAVGITVSYWRDTGAIRSWKAHAEHLVAQELGRGAWYRQYAVRVARVERAYSFGEA